MDANTTEITDSTAGDKEKQLFNILHELKIASGLSYLPKLYVMESPHMNAFASGWDEKNAIIVVTRTMMDELNREELQAVLAHELSHIRHHDIKLALTVSVLSNIMLLIAHYLFRESFQNSNSQGTRKKHNHPIIWCVIFVLYIIIPFVSTLLVMLLSRTREYLADAGAIELVRDNAGLASALLKIQASHPNKNHNTDRDHHGQLFDNPFERVRKPSYIYSVAQSSFGSKFLQDQLGRFTSSCCVNWSFIRNNPYRTACYGSKKTHHTILLSRFVFLKPLIQKRSQQLRGDKHSTIISGYL